jgi:hypothetical protein
MSGLRAVDAGVGEIGQVPVEQPGDVGVEQNSEVAERPKDE